MQKVKWYRLTVGGDGELKTYGMNVPGGVVLRCTVWSGETGQASLCFVPNVVLVEEGGEVGFKSIIADMMKLGAMLGAQVVSEAMGEGGR